MPEAVPEKPGFPLSGSSPTLPPRKKEPPDLPTLRVDFPKKEIISKAGVWLEPKLACEMQFTEWTEDGYLRHPVFKGLAVERGEEIQVVGECGDVLRRDER